MNHSEKKFGFNTDKHDKSENENIGGLGSDSSGPGGMKNDPSMFDMALTNQEHQTDLGDYTNTK